MSVVTDRRWGSRDCPGRDDLIRSRGTWRDGRISFIHDNRHARYVAEGAGLVLARASGEAGATN